MKPMLAFVAFVLFFQSPRAIGPQTPQDRGSVYGSVTDARNGEGLSSFQVFVVEEKIGTLTNEKGRFLLRGLPLGEATVQFQHPCFHPVTVQVELTSWMSLRRIDVGMPYDIEMEYAKGCDRRIR